VTFDRDRDGRLVGFQLLGSHLERLHVGILRIGDGIETHRPAVALARAGVRLGPECNQRIRQVFCSGSLGLDHKRAAAIALALDHAGVDRSEDGGGVVGCAHVARQDGGQQGGCAR
jgi:hypothetical protein